MVLEITHPEKPTEIDKIDDNDYMLPHAINGVLPDFSSFPGMKARIPILIEEKNLVNQGSFSFSNLNGDVDIEYLFSYHLFLDNTNSSYDSLVYLNPNGLNTNSESNRGYHAGTGHGSQLYNRLLLAQGGWGRDSDVFGELNFYAKTGRIRISYAIDGLVTTDLSNRSIQYSVGRWSNTSTNITSFQIEPVYCLLNGTIKLYKLVDINLEDLTPT